MDCPKCGNTVLADAQFCGSCGTYLGAASTPGIKNAGAVGFGEAIATGFQKYFIFSGRATRPEYWFFILFAFIVSIVANFLPFVDMFVRLALLIPGLAITSRRLHDVGKSGWYQLLWYYPLALIGLMAALMLLFKTAGPNGMFVAAAFIIAGISILGAIAWWLALTVRQGEVGPNKYGTDPRNPDLSSSLPDEPAFLR